MIPIQRTSTQVLRRARVSQWPSTTTSIHPPTCRRQLHVASFGEIVSWTAESMSGVHTAGVPWYLTIPMVAVAVNATFRLPTQYYARKLQAKRKELSPLGSVWAIRHAQRIYSSQNVSMSSNLAALRISSATQKSLSRIYKAWGVQRWKSFMPLISIVPFIIVSESIRKLCGASSAWIKNSTANEAIDKLTGAVQSVDPSMAEGGLWWFTDLTVSDPYYALPVLCSVILAQRTGMTMSLDQLRSLFTVNPEKRLAPIDRMQQVFGRLFVVMPILPLLFSHLPSAVFLYWLSSFSLQNINEFILTKMIKPPKSLTFMKSVTPDPPFLSRSAKIKTK